MLIIFIKYDRYNVLNSFYKVGIKWVLLWGRKYFIYTHTQRKHFELSTQHWAYEEFCGNVMV